MMELVNKYKGKGQVFLKNKFDREGSGWLFLQQVLIAPMSVLTTVLLTHFLSIESYGYYKYILSIYGIIAIFSFSGIYSISTLNMQRGQDNFFALGFKYKKLLRFIPSLISLGVAGYYFYMGNSFLATFFLINIFSYLIVDTYDFYLVALQGRGDYKANMKYATLYYLFSTFPPAITAIFTGNLYLIFIVMYLSQGIYRYVTFQLVKKRLRLKLDNLNTHGISQGEIQEFRKESLATTFNGALASAQVNASGVIIFNRLGAADNAIYSIALTFADFVSGMIGSTMTKIQLILSRITKRLGYTRESDQEKRALIRGLFQKYFWFALGSALLCALLLPVVYKFLFPKYYFSYHYAVVYSISILAVALTPAYQYLYEKRLFKAINIIQILTLALNLALLFFAAMYFGVWGAILVAILMRFVNNLVYTGVMYRNGKTYVK